MNFINRRVESESLKCGLEHNINYLNLSDENPIKKSSFLKLNMLIFFQYCSSIQSLSSNPNMMVEMLFVQILCFLWHWQ